MIEFELDGKQVSAPAGSNILEVALKEGRYIPHFCYHKKLSIAANCRMCLVEVEKAPKPMPACATPVTEGMKIKTCSKLAVEAQKGVMEFLLINHPLDCPICDQGGECQLQDLAIGYGRSKSRFEEEKRAVTNKDLGSLVSTEMTRCIHCSRCVRFTEEIAGFQELGMSYRNNHVEVMPFIGKTVNSELSGNIIDVCPVGALLSKPFKNKYRNWELSRRKSIAPHDGLGSNIIVQETAILYAAKSINGVKEDHGSDSIGVLASNISTTEELYLLQKLMRSIDVVNLDSRLAQSDFSLDGKISGTLSLGGKVADLVNSKSILLIGSLLREEQPLIASKIRTGVKKNIELNVINVLKEDLLCDVKNQLVVDPREIVYTLAQVAKAAGVNSPSLNLDTVQISDEASNIAGSLAKGDGYIVLGNIAKSLPDYTKVLVLADAIAKITKARFGQFADLANEVGASLVNFVPYKLDSKSGLNAMQMLQEPRRAYVLLNTELEYDAYNSMQALAALKKADTVVVLSPFISEEMKNYADVILPITPFTETAGSYINMEGRWQKFNGVTRPLGDSKPGWKVLRVLANNLNLAGFDYNNIEEVRSELVELNNPKLLELQILTHTFSVTKPEIDSLVRFGIQRIYSGDSITRRAYSLQQTVYAKLPNLMLNPNLAIKLKLRAGEKINLEQLNVNKELPEATLCDKLPESVILVSAKVAAMAGRFDEIKVNA
ncbi:MAG: NADH-quinone oxidoreductase subunit [Burkholderiales bacterium]|nr:NADH-quinone oxidoreductase subunit [Burkholderiales bacterium]